MSSARLNRDGLISYRSTEARKPVQDGLIEGSKTKNPPSRGEGAFVGAQKTCLGPLTEKRGRFAPATTSIIRVPAPGFVLPGNKSAFGYHVVDAVSIPQRQFAEKGRHQATTVCPNARPVRWRDRGSDGDHAVQADHDGTVSAKLSKAAS